MPIELILAITSFAFVTSVTPGPNNIMLTASGANFGFVKTIPHILGIVVGVAVMNFSVGFGLGTIFEAIPVLQQILKVAGSGYLVWLALKLLSFNYVDTEQDQEGRPLTLFQALMFQFINPKAWVMVISANASFSLIGEQYWPSVALIIAIFLLVGPPSMIVWILFGQWIRQFLTRPGFLRIFNMVMAFFTVSCVIFIWVG
ncbi:MAG: LysE family translocator [Gammaproteobacteria bacterium]|nr:LysE family translocator [Gammaproteobacteria bacterium]